MENRRKTTKREKRKQERIKEGIREKGKVRRRKDRMR